MVSDVFEAMWRYLSYAVEALLLLEGSATDLYTPHNFDCTPYKRMWLFVTSTTPSHLSGGYQGALSPGVKWLGHEADYSFPPR
jgi:hypothetical protein